MLIRIILVFNIEEMASEELKAILKKEGNYKAFKYKGYKCRIIRMGEGIPFEHRLFHLC